MQGESPDKLQIIQTHLQSLGSLAVIFVAEGDLFGVNFQNPMIGDRHFVCVPAQVFQYGFGMSERPLGVHHPLFLEELIDQSLLRFDTGLGRLDILGPEDFAHRFDRKEVFALGFGRLPLLVLSQSPSRHDAVQMGTKAERLPPSMQNGDHPGFGSQMRWVFGKATDRLLGSFKQTVVNGLGLVHRQLIQRVGQREHDMEVKNRKQFSFPLGDPILSVLALTLRAMAVSTTVVTDPGIPAVGAGTYVSTEVGRTATFEC